MGRFMHLLFFGLLSYPGAFSEGRHLGALGATQASIGRYFGGRGRASLHIYHQMFPPSSLLSNCCTVSHLLSPDSVKVVEQLIYLYKGGRTGPVMSASLTHPAVSGKQDTVRGLNEPQYDSPWHTHCT